MGCPERILAVVAVGLRAGASTAQGPPRSRASRSGTRQQRPDGVSPAGRPSFPSVFSFTQRTRVQAFLARAPCFVAARAQRADRSRTRVPHRAFWRRRRRRPALPCIDSAATNFAFCFTRICRTCRTFRGSPLGCEPSSIVPEAEPLRRFGAAKRLAAGSFRWLRSLVLDGSSYASQETRARVPGAGCHRTWASTFYTSLRSAEKRCACPRRTRRHGGTEGEDWFTNSEGHAART